MSYNSLFGLGSHSVDASLVSRWRMQDNAASTAVVDSKATNNGTLTNAGNTSASSVAGPTGKGWLPNALDLDGVNDYIAIDGTLLPTGTSARSIFAWVKPDNSGENCWLHYGSTATNGFRWTAAIDNGQLRIRVNGGTVLRGSGLTSGSFHHVGHTIGASETLGDIEFWSNGSSLGNGTSSVAINTNSASDARIGDDLITGSDPKLNGAIAELVAFSREITAAEVAEVYNGPEPLKTVDPSLSGTETEGEILTSTSGTWNSQSNGIATYAYQWTRSNDGAGAGEADIGSATAATYTLVAGDVGKFIRCRVRASNDGGFDSAEDTNTAYTGAISASGGTTYTLTCDTGSFTLTGIDAGLIVSRRLTADVGEFALTGIDAGLLAGRLLDAEVGSFALTGIEANLLANRLLGVDVGEFILTGIAADLTYSGAAGPTYTLTCEAGSFTLTGIDASLLAGRRISLDVSEFLLTGIDANVLANRRITADAGSFTLTGIDGAFVVTRRLTADTGEFVLTGINANLNYSGAPSSTAAFYYYYYLMLGA